MIPSKADRTVSGNLQGDRVAMSFDESSLAHIMAVLTDLYSDPELAIIREYSTNALDAHIEAGQTAPIEVTTPTHLSPYFKVKDHGIGMNVEDIHAIYSKYGASTKRHSNDAVGMLGLGCKSALTYASQFTLVAVKDGARCTVAISRDEDGAGSMTIVDTASTDQPNGVEVVIPARAGNTIVSKAKDFFSYWPEGTVLLDGREPERNREALKLTDDISLIQTDRYSSNSYVVMGNVPYPAGDDLAPNALGIPYGYAVVARVPVGTVDFAPSREALQMTKRTKAALSQVANDVRAGLIASVQRHIEDAPSRQEAIKAYNAWAKLLGRNRPDTFRYKGVEMPTAIQRPDGKRLLLTSMAEYRYSASSNVHTVEASYIENAIWVTDYEPLSLTPTHKKKMIQWADKAGIRASQAILVDFPLDTTWIDPTRVVAWETIKAEQLPKAARTASGRLPGSYDIIERKDGDQNYRSRTGVPGADIDQKAPVYWHQGNVWSAGPVATVIRELKPAFTIVCLPANRVEKFKRENPKFTEASEAIAAAFKAWTSRLSNDVKLAVAMYDQGDTATFRSLALEGIKADDPDIQEAVRVAQIDVTHTLEARKRFGRYGYRDMTLAGVTFTDPMDKYPLFSSYELRRDAEHIEAYLNWHYSNLADQS